MSRWWIPVERTLRVPSGSAWVLEFLSAPVPHSPARRARIHALLDQLLAQLALLAPAQEQPGDRAEGDDRAVDHHHRAGERLVANRREPVEPGAVVVDAVDRRPGPDEDVAEHGLEQADDDDVAQLGRGP